MPDGGQHDQGCAAPSLLPAFPIQRVVPGCKVVHESSAGDSLLTPLPLCTGKTPEEIRKTFNIPNDFTPEEEEEVRKENQCAPCSPLPVGPRPATSCDALCRPWFVHDAVAVRNAAAGHHSSADCRLLVVQVGLRVEGFLQPSAGAASHG